MRHVIMIKNGIRVYHYPRISHIKAAIYDGWACLGSANFDALSLRIKKYRLRCAVRPDNKRTAFCVLDTVHCVNSRVLKFLDDLEAVHEQEAVMRALTAAGIRDRVKVLIGGAPIDQAWADRIGADGFAPDAARAVEVSKELAGTSAGVSRGGAR